MTQGDDFVVTGPTDRLAELKNKIGSTRNIKALSRRFH